MGEIAQVLLGGVLEQARLMTADIGKPWRIETEHSLVLISQLSFITASARDTESSQVGFWVLTWLSYVGILRDKPISSGRSPLPP